MVFANTDVATSTIVRPTASGAENLVVISDESAPTVFSWHLRVGSGQRLTTLPDGTVVSKDDGPRAGVTYDAVSGLRPVFRPDGRVTAGNCCPLNDGAAAVVVMSDVRARELGITPLARIVSTGVSALSPEIMGLGPVESSKQALARAGLGIGDIDLVEINEAFAAQVIPSYQDLGIELAALAGSGPDGTITREDVHRAAGGATARSAEEVSANGARTAAGAPPPSPERKRR